jgi:hypothetical protein
MTKRLLLTLGACLLFGSLFVSPAGAAFSVTGFDVAYENEDGSAATQAGSHPYAVSSTIEFSSKFDPVSEKQVGDGSPKDLAFELPPGFVGDRAAVPTCSTADFLKVEKSFEKGNDGLPFSACPSSTAVGVLRVAAPGAPKAGDLTAAYNLAPPPGAAAKIGFIFINVPIALTIRVSPKYPYNLVATLNNTSDIEPVGASELTLWGNPASPAHDSERGKCLREKNSTCPVDITEKPFITLPRACTGALFTSYKANSWEEPGTYVNGLSTGALETNGCGKLSFGPTITAKPTTLAASSPSGLDFSLDVADEGLGNVEGLANSDVKKAVVTLPEGFSVNPSIAEGLNVCTEEQLEAETAFSAPGAGCPNASKIGTVEVETPLLDENVSGALFQAVPYENPQGSLIALYMVIKNPTLGILVTQSIRVEPDPVTGQLRTIADEIPQLPFSHFKLHFREGARSPLASPPGCGTYNATAELTPWSGGTPITTDSAFQIITGPESGPCPSGGRPPFHPGLIAGTINNAAGSYSPFNLRLFRSDSEQEITHFSIKLPPGITGKLAGIPFCPDAAIAAAKARTGPHGGREELNSPSCPAVSQIGRTLVGSGVGPSLAYAPGKLYLAGPYHGSAISLVAITAGVVGPFDIGTVVVREGFKIDPETAEVFIDSTGSDPIPHIIKGIPVHLRDIRAYADRPEFVLNPTSCERTSTASTVLGSGLDFGSEADDVPVTVSTPFQAADCASLSYKPELTLKLRGATARGGHPALRAILRPRAGDANSARVSVALPRSEFLDQGHIGTVCTRVQFKAGAGNGAQCPAASIYGRATAYTPILSEPLTGPVILRSSEHKLPDLVLALHGLVDFDAVGRIDSVNGGIRNTFETVPDVPVSKVVVDFQGGNKGLLENSTDLCRDSHRATAKYTGQNGKRFNYRPLMAVSCKKKKQTHRQGRGKRGSLPGGTPRS